MGRGEWSVCTDWSCIMRRGRKVKREALNTKKKKVANRILLGLHFVFVCRKKRKKRERKKQKMQLL